MIEPSPDISMRRQAELLRVNRSGLYYESAPTDQEELPVMRQLDELHLKLPFYGSRKLALELRDVGVRFRSRSQYPCPENSRTFLPPHAPFPHFAPPPPLRRATFSEAGGFGCVVDIENQPGRGPAEIVNQPGSTPPAVAKPSYRDVAPLEEGGRIARDGFAYQDHVTVGKCLEMLLVDGPSEVWCEAEDDIVLVWTNGGVEEFEFVQVKGHDLHQAWTVSKLCAREAGKGGKKQSSIVERSLAHDRGKEPCRFRIVTKWAPDEVLSILGTPPSARVAPEMQPLLANAMTAIESSLGACVSPNGNSLAFWVDRLEWEHRASIADVDNANRVKLHRVLDVEGESLAPDQSEVLLEALYARVQDAAMGHAVTHKLDKRLLRNEVRAWLLSRAKQIQHPTHSGGAGPLVDKLTEAAIDHESIEVAKELRRRYVAEARVPKYLPADNRDALEGEVLAALHALRVRLTSGACSDGGGEFLSRCQDELRRIRDTMTEPRPSEAVLYGYMYEVMNRCLHRLVRVQP